MSKAVIHLGAHKTGTTQLQSSFKINRDALSKALVLNLSRAAFKPVTKAIRAVLKGEDTAATVEKAFQKVVRSESEESGLRAGTADLIISDEDMLGMPNLAQKDRLYPQAGQAVSLLDGAIEAKDRLWLLTIRDLPGFIESSYIQQLKMGASYSLEAYLKRFPAAQLSWADLVERLLQAIPQGDRLSVHLYDGRNTNPKLNGDIESFLGALPLPETAPNVANPGYNETGIKLARAANRVLDNADDKREVRQFLQRKFYVEPGGPRPKLLDDDLREVLLTNMQLDLQRIRKINSDKIRVSF